MILDAHCHAWRYWPYEPPVPAPQQRGRAEQLLFEMDHDEVEVALVVSAQIEHNPNNNAYVADVCRRHAGRLYQAVDVDSMWSSTYRRPGGSQRLQEAVARWAPVAFTQYAAAEDDASWFDSEEGVAFFQVADRHGLLASLHCHPHQQAPIRRMAARFPNVRFLIHHLGHPQVAHPDSLGPILESAQLDNIYVKISGFYYATAGPKWEYPFRDVLPLVRTLHEAYGPRRLCWGSDYPVSRRFMTYRQALEAVRTHCDYFMTEEEQQWVLGGTLRGLLAGTRARSE